MKVRFPAHIDAMRHISSACLVSLVLIFSSTQVIAAKSLPSKVTGVFSDMAYNKEGGDVIGIEIFLVYSNRGYFAVYQSSEGAPSVPVVLPAKVVGSSVSFQIPSEIDSRGSFMGTIDNNELTGCFSGNGQSIHLKRKPSYWQ
jgi:hypothetical protein